MPDAARLWRDLLCLLGLVALAWLYHVFARVLPSIGLAATWALFATLIATALWQRARIRRRAFLAVYIAAASPLQRLLRGGPLLALRPLLLGGLLAILLMVALARTSDHWAWVALMASGPALLLLRARLQRRLQGHAGALYLPILSWRAAAWPVGAALMAVLAWLGFQQAYPDFAGVSLERAVWHMVDQERARSGPAEVLLQAAAAKDGVRLWLAQQLMPAPATSLLQLLGWLLILAEEVLFVWSYLLLCHGTLLGAGAIDRSDH
ncbi:MAG TPA: hypothetical protein PLI48_04070 [Gammaproteobacteria bacterium]|nr:hypothetical protein [Gammaproteobacteria bacterium]HRP86584.1 hypothetical protein [Gammaproteobacteria bacterium]